MPARRLKRYIAYNLGLWLAVALCGALLLVLVREYGNGLTRRHAAAGMVAGARDALDNGALYEAQNKACAALSAYPPVAGNMVLTMGRSLAGMPLVRKMIAELHKNGRLALGAPAAAMVALTGTPPPVLSALNLPGGADAPDEINLWAGRAALYAGDVALARDRFRQFWKDHPSEHDTLRQRLWPNDAQTGADLYNIGKRLLFNGLMPEAFQAFNKAGQAGCAMPDLLAMQGVQAELENRADEARNAYEAAVKALPTHRLALLRLRALTAPPQAIPAPERQ